MNREKLWRAIEQLAGRDSLGDISKIKDWEHIALMQ
jgi:hypothetical protein